MNRSAECLIPVALLVGLMVCSVLASAQTAQSHIAGTGGPIEIDARQPSLLAQTSNFTPGSNSSPSGLRIGLNDQYLTRDGKPWIPVMGEFHFSRYPAADWEEEILKMKAAGVEIISSYIFWNHIEEVQGVFDWTGQRDLRHFVELCQKHNMYFYLRVGPWAHGESRYGGLPDWVIQQSKPRTTDPRFLNFVDTLFREVGLQVKGLLWKDGGPIIGVQIENEYGGRGADGGPAYVLTLKKMALAAGLDTPLYTVTGWNNAVWPQGELLPVYGGYPDAPWDPGPGDIPPGEVYLFRFNSRITGDMGFIGSSKSTGPQTDPKAPFLTVEVGGGMQNTYHRRPVVTADDIAAMVPVMIGSGANMLGYYMFQGGENPDGKLGPLNESKATGYPSDLPTKTYDFEAPLSEFGLEQNAYGDLKLVNYFLNDFGHELAPMVVHPPTILPSKPTDNETVRVAARTKGNAGFIFINNHVRHLNMPEHKHFQIRLQLPSGPMLIPSTPINLPADTYMALPVNLDLDGLRLRYSTVQPFCRLTNGQTTLYVFFAVPGIKPELSFAPNASSLLKVNSGTRVDDPNQMLVSGFDPSDRVVVEGNAPDGKKVKIIVLTRNQAKSTTRVSLQDGIHLVISPSEVYSDGTSITLRAMQQPDFHFLVWPALLSTKDSSVPVTLGSDEGIFKTYRSTTSAHNSRASVKQLAPDREEQLSSSDPNTLPSAQEIEAAPRWHVSLPKTAFRGVADVFLKVDYSGDIARLESDSHLLTDHFYNGLPWIIGLKRFRNEVETKGVDLSIIPWRAGSGVVLDGPAKKELIAHRAYLTKVTAIPEYQLVVR